MSKDPNDPNDNPWDDNADDKESHKTSKKDQNNVRNPWAKQNGTSPFVKNNGNSVNNDIFSSLLKQFKNGNSGFNTDGGGNNGNGSDQKPPVGALGISKGSFIGIAAIGLLLWLSTGVFRVQDQGGEVAVILRFGKVVSDNVGPGLHYRLPYPIEQEIIKKTAVVNTINSVTQVDTGRNFDKTLVLTGDENMVHINYTVLWKIKDLKDFLFSVRNPEETILAAAESIVREVMGQTTARAALTQERDSIGIKAQDLLQKVLDAYKIGVQVVKIQLQKVDAPSEVIHAFNDMQASRTDGDRMRNEAEAYHFEIVPKARGESAKIVQEAEGYEKEVIARAQGEADRFNQVYIEYKKSPEVSRKRLYLDTMEHVLSRVHKTIIDPKAAPGLVPYFHLQPGLKADNKQG
ncbi:MAG: FtsH protease activity modulator HflK [Candidatus Paracaedibacteraceae bacterium]|nr:FtsH protease activity modulator HflK [Candidatus Paracaedibacteraceae bacterium]